MIDAADSETVTALRRANRALAALSACHHANAHAKREPDLQQDVCRAMIEVGGYRMAWIGVPEHDTGKRVRPVAAAGNSDGYLEAITVSWDDGPLGRGPVGTAVRTGQPSAVQDIRTDAATEAWRTDMASRGYAAVLGLPLLIGGCVHAVLAVYAGEPDAFDPEETRLLTQLADTVAFGISTLRERLGRQRAEADLSAREEQYRRIVETAQEGIWQRDAEHRTTFVNHRMAELLGYSATELVGTPVFALLHEDERSQAAAEMDLHRQGSGVAHDVRLLRRDGSVLWAHVTTNPVVDEGGRFAGSLAMVTDVTQRKQEEQVVRQARTVAEEVARLRQEQLEEAQALAAVSSALASTLDLNALYEVILEQAARVLPCDHACILRYEEGWVVVAASWGQHRQTPGTRLFPLTAIAPVAAYGAGGKPALIADTADIPWIDVSPFHGAYCIRSEVTVPLQLDQAVVGTFNVDSFTPNFYTERHLALAVILGERITQALRNAQLFASEQERSRTAEELARLRHAQAEAAEALAFHATHDHLTGLPNRTLLLERLTEALTEAAQSGEATALLLIDLDRFKEVNDTLGSSRGRPHVAASGRTPLGDGTWRRPGGAPGWRRVCNYRALRHGGDGPRAGRPARSSAGAALRHSWSDPRDRGEHRHCPRARPRQGPATPAAARRCGDVSGQARPAELNRVCRGAGSVQPGTARADAGSAPGVARGHVDPPLPTEGLDGNPPGVRRRSTPPLAASGPRADPAGPVHPHRRANWADWAVNGLGVGDRIAAVPGLAE